VRDRERGLRQLASWIDRRHEDEDEREKEPVRCLACGVLLDEPFTRLGSLRCLECRSLDRCLDPELVGVWRANGGHLH
jgi:hypothetical protein